MSCLSRCPYFRGVLNEGFHCTLYMPPFTIHVASMLSVVCSQVYIEPVIVEWFHY